MIIVFLPVLGFIPHHLRLQLLSEKQFRLKSETERIVHKLLERQAEMEQPWVPRKSQKSVLARLPEVWRCSRCPVRPGEMFNEARESSALLEAIEGPSIIFI